MSTRGRKSKLTREDLVVLARVFGFHDAAALAQFIREQDEKRLPKAERAARLPRMSADK